jgi:hypothetical protein
VELRDRLSYGQNLLNEHRALTGFFDGVVSIMPTGVRFDDMHLAVGEAGVVTLETAGIAESFNALAATSDAFAKDGRVKNAIFSGIRVEDGAVRFTLIATVDASLVAFTPRPVETEPVETPAP